jgi:hypothetical protein
MIKLRYCLILIGIALFLSAIMTASKASDVNQTVFGKPTISSVEGKQVVIDGLTVSPKENEHIDSPLFYKRRLR